MTKGLDNLKHIVVLMMSGRSFDHMLGSLKWVDPRIDGLTGNETNRGISGEIVPVQPLAEFQGQLNPDPDQHFPGVDLQIFGGDQGDGRVPNMQGFVKSYYQQQRDIDRSHKIMYYFTPEKLPVLTTLVSEFAVFDHWFSSVPGPMICNHAFAHYGTSFGQVGMNIFYATNSIISIYERLLNAGCSAKIYYYDLQSSSLATVNLLKNQPRIFASYIQFLADCEAGTLPQYSFIEPNHVEHTSAHGGMVLASDQHPDHNIQEGERFIANTYNVIRANPKLWRSTAILILYDQHGGIYDHVIPPACTPDGYVARADATGTGQSFAFDRLGVRVPAILVSPYIPKGTVVPGIFEHASIPNTVTNFFLKDYGQRTVREKQASSFLVALGDELRGDDDSVVFEL
jgi:phospholipase C